jgi:hypothetical protein
MKYKSVDASRHLKLEGRVQRSSTPLIPFPSIFLSSSFSLVVLIIQGTNSLSPMPRHHHREPGSSNPPVTWFVEVSMETDIPDVKRDYETHRAECKIGDEPG